MNRLLARWNARFDERLDVGHLAWMRIGLGLVTLVHLRDFVRPALRGRTYLDAFHVPYASWLPDVPEPLYIGALLIATVGAVLVTVGFVTRPAAGITAAVVGANLFVTQTHYSNNRAFLFILLVGLASLPVGARWSVDAWLAERRGATRDATTRAWVLDLLRFEVAAVYVGSGLSKLIDPDWWGGAVLAIRVERGVDGAVNAGVPRSFIDLLADPATMWWIAKVVVLTELFIGLGLWFGRTRVAAIVLAVLFHLSIEATAEVEVFSWAALAALPLWLPLRGDVGPSRRDRPRRARWLRRAAAA